MAIKKTMKRREIPSQTKEVEQKNLTMQLMFTKRVISYKEYKARKEVEQGPSATDKSTLGKDEDWDAELSLPA